MELRKKKQKEKKHSPVDTGVVDGLVEKVKESQLYQWVEQEWWYEQPSLIGLMMRTRRFLSIITL